MTERPDPIDSEDGERRASLEAVRAGAVARLALMSVPLAVLAFAAFLLFRDVGVAEQAGPTSEMVMAQAGEGASAGAGIVLGDAVASLPDVMPPTPWMTLDPEAVLTRIGVGSCLSQRHPQPIWSGILGLSDRPDVFLMIGDNVYGDVKSPDLYELSTAYRSQGRQPEFAKARAAFPFLATWDDHDYGRNDGGADFIHRVEAAKLFKSFWALDTGRPSDQGIFYARTIGPVGKRVQLIFLDTRFFRGSLSRKTASFPYWGRYEPSLDATQTMLGEAQWSWLEAELSKPADIRIIASSIQVLAEGHGFERWGNLPHERTRLMDTIERTAARGVVFVSGDRHAAAMYAAPLQVESSQRIVEMTASSLNRSYGPSKDADISPRTSPIFHQENFGLVDIDWEERRLTLSLRGLAGEPLTALSVSFSDLGVLEPMR